MENLILTQLTVPEVRQIFRQELRQELKEFFSGTDSGKPNTSKDKPFSTPQAAAYVNLAIPTIYTLVGQRKIPFYKKGRKLYFSKADLDEWINSGRNKTSSEIEEEAMSSIGVKRARK